MKTRIKIALIAMIGMNLGVTAQDEVVNGKLTVNGLIHGGFGARTTSGVKDWNDITNAKSGNGYTLLNNANAANAPGTHYGYYHPFNFEYTSKNGTGNLTQLAIPYGNGASINNGIWMRGRYSGSWSNWVRVLSEGMNGNVGVGTTNPKEKLDVNGSVIIKNGHNLSWGNKYGAGIPTIAANTNSGLHFYPSGSSLGATMQIFKDGKTKFTNNIVVLGKIESKEVKVTNTPTADFVFEENYNLPSLKSIEKHIKKNKHLPEIASAKEMEKNGVNLGDFQIQLLQKIEELTLYTIDQQKEIEELKRQNSRIKDLEVLVQKLLKDKN